MQIQIMIPSSCDESPTKLTIENVNGRECEVLLTIESIAGTQDIYVLAENLRDAILKIMM